MTIPLTNTVYKTHCVKCVLLQKIIHKNNLQLCFYLFCFCSLLLFCNVWFLSSCIYVSMYIFKFQYIISRTCCKHNVSHSYYRVYCTQCQCITDQCVFPIMLFVRYLILFTEHNIWCFEPALYCCLSIIQSNLLLGGTLNRKQYYAWNSILHRDTNLFTLFLIALMGLMKMWTCEMKLQTSVV